MTETLRIVFEDHVCEEVDAHQLQGNCFRLLMTPVASSTGARYGDEIELQPEEGGVWRFKRILKPSPLITSEWLVSEDVAESLTLTELLREVRESGGEWERAFGGIVFLHLPDEVNASFIGRLTKLFSPSSQRSPPP
jgi:hypothetical protein